MGEIQKYAIIVAGGSGKRMGAEIPKQFIEVGGKPILMHTIERFYTFDEHIKLIVVLPEKEHLYWYNLIKKHSFTVEHSVVNGGEERFFSVKNGLSVVKGEGLIAVHDGVRPFVSDDTLNRCFNAALRNGAVVPVLPSSESIREIRGDESIAVNRSNYVLVQTPQVFKSNIILDAYSQPFLKLFTDDASVVEKNGGSIFLVEGNEQNIKITRPFDLLISKAILSSK